MLFRLAVILISLTSITSLAQSSPGERVLSYLHSRGEAGSITNSTAIKAVYLNTRDVDWARPELAIQHAVAQGFNVIVLT